ncbi:CheR family methyltransferase [Allocoleopsis sp.]|uniref:CheR family methyltransferase n=1 Tax=Allocoleopsis sp. TaxID=3088169 RepID=UPI002FCFD67E
MIQETIEALLKDQIGLSANIIGSQEIARAVEKRQLACNLPDLPSYLQRLQTSTQERAELIELVIVPETWFFRDGEPFTFLAHYVTSEWLSTQSYRILRLLSLPCSSGEEPYSIAMTLLDAGLTPNQFCIDAVDISKKSLLKAQRAVYSRHSFRGNDLEFRERYFTKTGDEYQLCDLVKNAVNFMHGNLLEPNFLISNQPYDVIFCRNVLIYFDRSSREKSLRNLYQLLKPQGLLFVGHAETGQLSASQFDAVRHSFAFAYRKKDKQAENSQALKKTKSPNNQLIKDSKLKVKSGVFPKVSNQSLRNSQPFKTKPLLQKTQISIKGSLEKTESSSTQNSTQPPPLNLASVRQLADQGQLSEAANLGETYLKQNTASVEAYVLLGQVYQAMELEQKAEQCFQKAIYLEPNHYDALVHLTLLKEQRGDVAKASVLRQRIQRLQKF